MLWLSIKSLFRLLCSWLRSKTNLALLLPLCIPQMKSIQEATPSTKVSGHYLIYHIQATQEG